MHSIETIGIKFPIPAQTASKQVVSHIVYDIGRNVPFYVGDEASCLELEFANDRYVCFSL